MLHFCWPYILAPFLISSRAYAIYNFLKLLYVWGFPACIMCANYIDVWCPKNLEVDFS